MQISKKISSTFFEKNVQVSVPTQFMPMLFKGHLYIIFIFCVTNYHTFSSLRFKETNISSSFYRSEVGIEFIWVSFSGSYNMCQQRRCQFEHISPGLLTGEGYPSRLFQIVGRIDFLIIIGLSTVFLRDFSGKSFSTPEDTQLSI